MLADKELKAKGLEGIYFIGEVTNNDDSNLDGGKKRRIQVRVSKIFDRVSVEDLPWAMPDTGVSTIDVPRVGQKVWVKFQQGNVYFPIYSGVINSSSEIKDLAEEDYPNTRGIFDGKNWIVMNSKTGKITIKTKKSSIILDSDGNVNIEADGGVNVTAGTEIVMSAPLIRNN